MPGPWEKYQSAPSATAKPWEKYSAAEAPDSTAGGYLAATAAGLARGATMGGSDQKIAQMEAANQSGGDEAYLEAVNPLMASSSLAGFQRDDDKFKAAEAEVLQNQAALQKAYPKVSFASELAGGLAGPAALVGDGAGAVLGKGLKAVGSKIIPKARISALAEGAETLAEKNALRSAGAQKSQMKALVNKGRVKDTGRFIIDENIVPPGASAEDVFANANKLKKEAGESISSVFDELEKAGKGGTFNRKELAKGMRESLLADDAVGGSLDASKVMGQLEGYIDDFAARDGAASARELLALKGKLDARINYARKSMDLPELQQGYKNLRGVVNDTITSRAEKLSNQVRGDLGKKLAESNRKYGLASEVESIAENQLAQEGNRFFSLSDSIAGAATGAAGLATGGIGAIPAAAGGALFNKAMRTYGPALGTKGLDAAARTLRALEGSAASTAMQGADDVVRAGIGRQLLKSAGNERARASFTPEKQTRRALRIKAMGE